MCVYVGVYFYILRFGVDSTENHNKTKQKKKTSTRDADEPPHHRARAPPGPRRHIRDAYTYNPKITHTDENNYARFT